MIGRIHLRTIALAIGLVAAGSALTGRAGYPVINIQSQQVSMLTTDVRRPYVYGLVRTLTHTNRGALLVINAETEALESIVPLGPEPTDMDVDQSGNYLYVIHYGDQTVWKIDLATFNTVDTCTIQAFPAKDGSRHYHIDAATNDILYCVDDAWAPAVHRIDFATGQELGPTVHNNIGDLIMTRDGQRMYSWYQFGWGAGNLSTFMYRIDCSQSTLSIIDYSVAHGSRDPLDTPLFITADESRVVNKYRALSATNMTQILTIYEDNIYGISLHGDIVFGTTKAYAGLTGQPIFTYPFSSTIMAVSGDQKQFLLYHPTQRKIYSIPVDEIAGIPGPGLNPTPADHATVAVPLEVLAWTADPLALGYHIYLGTNAAEVAVAGTNSPSFLGATTGTSLAPSNLMAAATYYWRVDGLGVFGLSTGTVWTFTTANLSVMPSRFIRYTVAGYSPSGVSFNVTSAITGDVWTASASASWFSLSTTQGVGPGVVDVHFDATGLESGLHSGVVQVASATEQLTVPVLLEVKRLQITRMLTDYARPYIYALQPGENAQAASLLFINTESGLIEKVLPTGSNPTDLTINYAEARLYVNDWPNGPVRIYDLATQAEVGFLALYDAYKINAGGHGLLIYENEDQWINAHLVRTSDGQELAGVFLREGDGEADATGRYYYHCDNNISSATINKFDMASNRFQTIASAPFAHPYGSRNLVLSRDGTRLFWRGFVYNSSLDELASLGKEVYAASLHGELAFTYDGVVVTDTGQQIYSYPVASDVMALSGSQDKLFLYDPTQHRMLVIPMTNIAVVPDASLVPVPADRATISLPLNQLSWSVAPDALSYQVYLGTNEAAVSGADTGSPAFLGPTTNPSIALATQSLAAGVTYFWRVDSLGFGTKATGTVWRFDVASFSVAPLALDVASILGVEPQPVPIHVGATQGLAWTVSVAQAWMQVASSSGNGTGTATIAWNTSGLAAGTYSGRIHVISGIATVAVPVKLTLFQMNLSKLITDYERPYLYGLHPGSGNYDDAYVLFINTESEQIEKAVLVGRRPTDLTIAYDEDRLYTGHYAELYIRAIDLLTKEAVDRFDVPSDPSKLNAAGGGRLIYENDNQWIGIYLYDTVNRVDVASMGGREGDGEVDPTGQYYYHCENNISSAALFKYRILTNGFQHVATVPWGRPYGSRNLVISRNGGRVFWQGWVYDENLNELFNLGEQVYSVSSDGKVAVCGSTARDAENGQTLFTLPASTSVSAFSRDQQKLAVFDGSAKKLHFMPMGLALDTITACATNAVTDEDVPVQVVLKAVSARTNDLFYKVVLQPAFGSLGGTPPNLVYQPSTNYSGVDAFAFVAHNGVKTSAMETVMVHIQPVNDAPVAIEQHLSTMQNTPVNGTLAATDVDSTSLAFRITSGPSHGSIAGTLPSFTYTPAAGYTGSDSVGFTASDGAATSLEKRVFLTIVPPDRTDLIMAKTVDRAATLPGGHIAFTLAVSNAGPLAATGVRVIDHLPGGLVYVGASSGGYDPSSGAWQIGALGVGARTVLVLRASIALTATGLLVNEATVSAASPLEAVSSNNTARAAVRITQRAVSGDFDGDGLADYILYNPPQGFWYILMSSGNLLTAEFGYEGAVPVPRDYDGDGRFDLAVYDDVTGSWYVLCGDGTFLQAQFGYAGTLPVPEDYDGDGLCDMAVYDPASGVWYIAGTADGMRVLQLGYAGVQPAPLKGQGDDREDPAVFDMSNGQWYIADSATGELLVRSGVPGAKAVPLDYDGDGVDELGVYTTGRWTVLQDGGGYHAQRLGLRSSMPVPQDGDGDGRDDLCVYEPRAGTWILLESSSGAKRRIIFGFPGAVPVAP
jgi:uncharacterized repeat protein (TIGR01451 family)